jgi:(4S)-4-hydroxy-5-phosphonooxypentane-2,3-dione isomerase
MPKFAIVATIEVLPGRIDEFLPILMAHKARCLKEEPGTLLFEVLRPRDDDTKVMLYELYQDDAAFDVHVKGSSIAHMREESAGMTAGVSATRCTQLD